jgi:hypothetical protein
MSFLVLLSAAARAQDKEPEAKPLKALIKELTSTDAAVRRDAAIGLGSLGKGAEEAVPDLVAMLANAQEDRDVRAQVAVALARIGKVPAAQKAIPALVNVQGNVIAVRERTLWALRVHGTDLQSYPDFFKALAGIVAETPHAKHRMLRYDSACTLGMLKKADVPEKALDVLLDFLKDDTIRVYAGVTDVAGDGRAMAVQALREIGPTVVRARKDIMAQLRALYNSQLTLPNLRLELEKAQSKLGDLSATNP